MGLARRATAADPVGQCDLANYWRDGYAIIRGFVAADEIAEISAALDQLHAEGAAHGRCFRHGNLFYNVADGEDGTPLVRMVQWPSYHQPVLNRVRLDGRFAKLLEPLIGRDLKQIINQVHWKVPGSLGDFCLASGQQVASSRRCLSQPCDVLRPDGARDRSAQPGIRMSEVHSRKPSAR